MTATRIDELDAQLRYLNRVYKNLAHLHMNMPWDELLQSDISRNWQEWEKVRDELHKLLAERNAEERERKEGRR